MIALAAALALAGPSFASRVVEVVDPTERTVSIEAILPVPDLGPRDQATIGVLAEVLTEDTATFGKQQWRDLAGRAGEVVRCVAMPDHIEVSMGCLPQETGSALSMLSSILREAKLPQEAIDQAAQSLSLRHYGYWLGTLRPEKLDYLKVRRSDVVEMYHRLFTPDSVTLGVGGPIQPGSAQRTWDGLTADWARLRMRPPLVDHSPMAFFERLDVPVSMIEIRGPGFASSDAAFSTRLLALIGLGVGKGSSLFRVVREKHGWSYVQDAVLWPTPNGFVPRLLVAQKGPEGLDSRSKEIRSELTEDVKAWTAADLQRAQGIAESVVLRGLEVSPLFWRSARTPMAESIDDRTFLAAYWTMKTGSRWNPAKVLDGMRQVSLEDFQQSATDMLGSSIVHVYPGR